MLHRWVIALLICPSTTLVIMMGQPVSARAECTPAAELFDTQRRARGLLMAANAHRATSRAFAAERRVWGPENRTTLIFEGARWFGVSVCMDGEEVPADMLPMEMSYRRDHRVELDDSEIRLGLVGMFAANALGNTNGSGATEDGLRLYLGAEAQFDRWLSLDAALISEDAVLEQGEPERHAIVGVGVPALHVSLTAIIGDIATPPETVLLDVDVPIVDWLSAPARLTWREDEALMSLRVGLENARWGGGWIALEDSEETVRSAGGHVSLLWRPNSAETARLAPHPEAAPGGVPPGVGLGLEGALTYSGGRTIRVLAGQALVGGAIDFAIRFNVPDATGAILFGWARNDATVLDELPHMAGFDVYRVQFHVQVGSVPPSPNPLYRPPPTEPLAHARSHDHRARR